VTTDSRWSLDKDRLADALERFHRHAPDVFTKHRVHDWLMDVVQDPYRKGTEDPQSPGTWFGRVLGTDIGILYTIDPATGIVYISDIG
jgi:hypothetical protein